MLLLTAFALVAEPAFTFRFFATVVLVIAAFAVLFWLLRKATIPEPFNLVVFAVMALLALWLLFRLFAGLS